MQTCLSFSKKTFIDFLREIGITINTHTKARGHQGVFFKNRIDVSKKLEEKRSIEVMAHEFAHYIHSKIEPEMARTGGSLEKLFCIDEVGEIATELYELTLRVDENSSLAKLKSERTKIKGFQDIEEQIIKLHYPHFTRSREFVEFNRYIKKSKARFFLKYDKITFITLFLKKREIYSIDNIEQDFPDIPKPFVAYLKFCSLKRKRAKISRRINKFTKYYKQPTELFARFIESFFISPNLAKTISPITFERFCQLLKDGYYQELKELFIIANLYNYCSKFLQ